MPKSIDEINSKIKNGAAVILTAEEVKKMAQEQGVEEIAKKVDVVTTATFGPMCSSGAFINFGHADPPIKMVKIWLNDVSAYGGLAAVDTFIGATEISEREQEYGGAHVIEDLIAGKDIKLRAIGAGTDCYPRKEIETFINKENVNECFLLNPRNVSQNYAAATNSTDNTIYTYMGILLPTFGNATYSTTGELSPLLNDPELRSIGIGTKIFLGGAQGFVVWNGTQFNTTTPRNEKGLPIGPAANLCLVGNIKEMSIEFIKAAVFEGYGISLFIGAGVPIPILDEDMAKFVSIRDEDIKTKLCDYGLPGHPVIAELTYKELKSGEIKVNGRLIKTGPLSSMYKSRQIADILKEWLQKKDFFISQPVQRLPENSVFKNMNIKKGG
ncbi:MAG: homocysteine biosynthesis protein [bacterium]